MLPVGTYIYQVAAQDAAGNLGPFSSNTNSVQVTGGLGPVRFVNPPTPSNGGRTGQVHLLWSRGGCARFIVEWGAYGATDIHPIGRIETTEEELVLEDYQILTGWAEGQGGADLQVTVVGLNGLSGMNGDSRRFDFVGP
jgi:hypothetical protein